MGQYAELKEKLSSIMAREDQGPLEMLAELGGDCYTRVKVRYYFLTEQRRLPLPLPLPQLVHAELNTPPMLPTRWSMSRAAAARTTIYEATVDEDLTEAMQSRGGC